MVRHTLYLYQSLSYPIYSNNRRNEMTGTSTKDRPVKEGNSVPDPAKNPAKETEKE